MPLWTFAAVVTCLLMLAGFKALGWRSGVKGLLQAVDERDAAIRSLHDQISVLCSDRDVEYSRLASVVELLVKQRDDLATQIMEDIAKAEEARSACAKTIPLFFKEEDAVTAQAINPAYPNDREILLAVIERDFPPSIWRLADRDKCIETIRYVSTVLSLGFHDRIEAASVTLASGVACCGAFAFVFAELLRVLGVPCRYIGLFGLPGAGSHALAEAFYDGSWHLFDPTFGIFFTDGPDWGTSSILSAREIVTRDEPPSMMSPVSFPWTSDLVAQRGQDVGLASPELFQRASAYWQEERRLVGFPVAFGADAQPIFPIRIDFATTDEAKIGDGGGCWRQLYQTNVADPATGYFLLGGSGPDCRHMLIVENAGRCELEIEYHSAAEDVSGIRLVCASAAYLLGRDEKPFSATFLVKSTGNLTIVIIGSERAIWLDQIRVTRRTSQPNHGGGMDFQHISVLASDF